MGSSFRGIEVPDQQRVTAQLHDARWTRIEVLEQTGSTNADLLARIEAGDDVDGAVVIAGRQTSGRGRHARVWETPPGQLAISAAVRVPSDAVAHVGWLSLLTGLAVYDAVTEVVGAALESNAGAALESNAGAALESNAGAAPGSNAGAAPELKWPNDVLAPGGGKLAGILSEFRLTPGGDPATAGVAVIGTGLNVDLPPGAAPDTAASISALTAGRVDRTAIAVAYLRALSERLDSWPDRIEDLAAGYREISATLGSRVRLVLPGDVEVIGDAVDIDEEGRVVVDRPDGRITASAGDVTHLRPAP